MTLLYFDGFDNCILMKKPEVTHHVTGTGDPFVATGRDGSAQGAFGENSGFNGILGFEIDLPTPATTLYIGMAYYPPDNPLTPHASDYLFGFQTTGDVLRLVLRHNETGFLELRLASGTGTVIATSTGHTAITLDAWHHIEAKVTLDATSANVQVHLDGQTVINFTGVTSAATGDITGVRHSNKSARNEQWRYDDLWVCDGVDATATQGRPFNDFLGDAKVVTVVPDGAGDETNWTPSTGANYATLDENPVSPTADYVSVLASLTGTRDLYSVGNLPVAATVALAVQPRGYANKSDAGTAKYKHVVKENGVVTAMTEEHFLSITASGFVSAFMTKRPSDGAVWSVADVNAMQTGVVVT